MTKAGQKILAGLKDAVAGNFSKVTIEGQTWTRDGILTENAKEYLIRSAAEEASKWAGKGWQPIETAPKNGARVLLYVVHPADEYAIAGGSDDGWQYIDVGFWEGGPHGWHHEHAGEPTHWMPLPAPPISKGDRA